MTAPADEGHNQQLITTWRARALNAEAKCVAALAFIEENAHRDDWGVDCVYVERLIPLLEVRDA